MGARADTSSQRNGKQDLRPPLKWAGGKRWLVPRVAALWAGHSWRRLVEPCCGGLAIAFGLRPECALLNDVNVHLINFYRWLQRGLTIDLPLSYDCATYFAFRDRFNELISSGEHESREAAALFYYLNRTGYNGLCRFNSRGQFNVPFGRYSSITYTLDFAAYRPVLARWQFSTGDFEAIDLERDDFIYADPPYDVEFTRYSDVQFSWNDQERLAHWLAGHHGPVVASNQATARIVSLYQSLAFDVQFVDGPRLISCTGDRTPAREMLATRNLTL